mgnify:CR=1 FL=1
MAITEDEARKVAHLARIAVDDADLPALAQELNSILHFMEQLNEVDVDGVEPMTGVEPMRLKRRADIVTDGEMQDLILKNAPDAREGFFAVHHGHIQIKQHHVGLRLSNHFHPCKPIGCFANHLKILLFLQDAF